MLVRLIWRYLRHYKAAAAIVIAAQLVATVSSLLLPNLNAKIIDQGVSTGDTGYIWRTGLLMLAISVGQIGGQMVAAFFGARLAMGVGRDIRAAFFDRTLTFSQQEVNRFGAPSLITRNTNDVQQVQQLLLMTAIMLIGARSPWWVRCSWHCARTWACRGSSWPPSLPSACASASS